ncbi:MAG: ABC-F family ATP-binding cassette domain-containing protein [Rickettsiales bacterium]|nr:ABC-F family ATP-binding cassette domain-containing protein [Rickettsiales bacterium]
MKNAPLLAIRNATISFAKKTLFENLDLLLFQKDKICLIGKNGVGKTSLINFIAGKVDADCGERWVMSNVKIGYLQQDEKIPDGLKVFDFVINSIQSSSLAKDFVEHKSYLILSICDKLEVDPEAYTENLSGGQKRRVNLAKALILEPEILLLDEPTNHLDLKLINWLESYLLSYKGALIVISHDRKFLEQISNKVFWLRSGSIKINNFGYKNFDEWSRLIIEQEERELHNLNKKVELESGWLQTGVTARRKRNIGRLHYLQELRGKLEFQKNILRSNSNSIKIHNFKIEEDSPQVIISLNNISKNWNIENKESLNDFAKKTKKIINNFSLKILRGEKIGVIGPNGAGKSTFLKMLIGEIDPDSGTVKRAIDLSFSYFDQMRSKIANGSTIKNILCESGGDHVLLANGKTKHICGYMKDFLFDPKDIDTRVDTLSGGQQNRLLLAKILANPGNFLILDEPTNDLDMDSLDLLQEYLVSYQGTMIVVSHDRDFLDNVVTSVIAFEGEGEVFQNLGGYSDYVDYVQKYRKSEFINQANKNSLAIGKFNTKSNSSSKIGLSNKQLFELDKIIVKIDKLEQEIAFLTNQLIENADIKQVQDISNKIAKLQLELDSAENKWMELESLKGN